METFQGLLSNYPMLGGIILGIVIGFIPSVIAGHYGNKWTERRNRKSLDAKKERFIDGLSAELNEYIHLMPVDEADVLNRQEKVKSKVKELSNKFFDKHYPEIQSSRPESTEYPSLPCKWCHQQHKASAGSRGDCKKCNLPFDLWMGSQGQTETKVELTEIDGS